jgi:predicted glycogen debranching enzyme
MAALKHDLSAEWIETDGLGGFASGTVGMVRTRRYHALLLASANPPTDRYVLVNGLEAWLDTPHGSFPIHAQRYDPGVTYPQDTALLECFEPDPIPRWTYSLPGALRLEQELFVKHGSPLTCLGWRVAGEGSGASLRIRLFFSGRDLHALHHENADFDFEPESEPGRWRWRPYPGVPEVSVEANGTYEHRPQWYRRFLYEQERARGFDGLEDLASPGIFRFDLEKGEAVMLLSASGLPGSSPATRRRAAAQFTTHRNAELKRRGGFPSRLQRSADAYLVQRGKGRTVIAGYPWFTDWGRDTFIALRGLCLVTDRLREARDILVEWSRAVSEGMLPNRFPDRGEVPEYNSVDASLWYIVAVQAFLQAARSMRPALSRAHRHRLQEAVEGILEGYAGGTRYGIAADSDGLLRCGQPGVQLTWMDAKVGDWVVTPRTGKPVEIQALWINALAAGSAFSKRWDERARLARESFERRFWLEEEGYLCDVVDVDHRPGSVDRTFRPNQIYAVGGLSLVLLPVEKARRMVSAVERRLLTPLGLRTLAPEEAAYVPRYEGGPKERDSIYHQGSAWPYLLGPFVEAWVRVHGEGKPAAAIDEARKRFLQPLLEQLDVMGIGHLPELADGDPPHTPRGCPFQAWSVAEALRLAEQVLVADRPKAAAGQRRRSTLGSRPLSDPPIAS